MSDWKISELAWQDIRHERVDQFVQAQRTSFIEGFEAAVDESQSFDRLREYLEAERDNAREQYDKTGDEYWNQRRLCMIDVLVKISEIGCRPEETND